jgi:ketosteroid isomerase-like protein
MRFVRKLSFPLLFAALLFTAACTQQPPPEPPDTRAAEEAAIREGSAGMLAAAQAKDADRLVSYFTDDVVVHYSNFPQQNKQEARDGWAGVMANAGYAIQWGAHHVEVARSGDLAVELGNYEFTQNDARGRPVVERGTYIQSWRKQADGSWKISADLAVAAPAN